MNVQMNIRIDDQLKSVGDSVFREIGLTPTQVVRSVWEYAATHQDAPHIVLAALENPSLAQEQTEADRIESQIDSASSICAQLREAFDLKAPDHLEALDYRSLRQRAQYERLEERGLA